MSDQWDDLRAKAEACEYPLMTVPPAVVLALLGERDEANTRAAVHEQDAREWEQATIAANTRADKAVADLARYLDAEHRVNDDLTAQLADARHALDAVQAACEAAKGEPVPLIAAYRIVALLNGDDPEGEHFPWQYTEFGVNCICGSAMDRDENCLALLAASRSSSPDTETPDEPRRNDAGELICEHGETEAHGQSHDDGPDCWGPDLLDNLPAETPDEVTT